MPDLTAADWQAWITALWMDTPHVFTCRGATFDPRYPYVLCECGARLYELAPVEPQREAA